MFGILRGFGQMWNFSYYFSNQVSILASHAIAAISVWRAWGEYNFGLFLHIFIFASSGAKKKIINKPSLKVRKWKYRWSIFPMITQHDSKR